MLSHAAQQHWYAVRVKPRHEKVVSGVLRSKGFETFLPVYHKRRTYGQRSKEVELPLFDGYVFCKFDPAARLPIVMTPSVIYVLSNGRVPLPIDENEIGSLQRAIESRLALFPHDYLQLGERVRICDGVLSGIEGILLRLKKYSLVLSITLLRRSVEVEIDPACVAASTLTMHASGVAV